MSLRPTAVSGDSEGVWLWQALAEGPGGPRVGGAAIILASHLHPSRVSQWTSRARGKGRWC